MKSWKKHFIWIINLEIFYILTSTIEGSFAGWVGYAFDRGAFKLGW